MEKLPEAPGAPESSALKQLSVEDSGFSVTELVELMRHYPDAIGIGVWRNEVLDAGCLGETRGACFGPSNTYQTAESLPAVYPGNISMHWAYRLKGYVPRASILEESAKEEKPLADSLGE